MGMRSPFMRSMGGTPTARCTSEQPCCMPSFRNASMRATVGAFPQSLLTQACGGERGRQCDAVRVSFRVRGLKNGDIPDFQKKGTRLPQARPLFQEIRNVPLPELLERGAQFRHRLEALVLVDGHG